MSIQVIGDAILDEFCIGTVRGLSPEAPVPVLRNPSSTKRLGGALNTYKNIASLGGNVLIDSIIGDDDAGEDIARLSLEVPGTANLLPIKGFRTPHKVRYSSNGHSFMRVDFEDTYDSRTDLDLGSHESKLFTSDTKSKILVISDYGKGLISDNRARKIISDASSSFVIVDSKKTNFDVFENAGLVTPNLLEGRLATGLEEPSEIIEAISKSTKGAVLLTLGARGMLFLDKGGCPVHIEAEAQEVSDVTGAGDSVVAAISVALSEGSSLLEAITWSAKVASIAVAHSGTYAVSRIEAGSWKNVV